MASTVTKTSWVTYPKANNQARLRLFCFHYAGGGAHIFRSWPDGLPGTVEVCAVQLPGRGAQLVQPAFTCMGSLVDALTKVLLPHLNKPFAFFGHSMGALVGFELARQLKREYALEPLQLFVSACFAPQIPDPHPIHHLPEDEFLEQLRSLNGVPDEVLENSELLQLMLPTLRADCMLTETYTCTSKPSLSCPITVFGGSRDPFFYRDHLEAWHEQTSGPFSLRMVPGDHFFLHTAQTLLLGMLYRELQTLMTVAVPA